MTSSTEILDEIMFYILKRAKCEEDTDKYLEHILDYCRQDYQKAFKNQNKNKLTIDEVQRKFENQKKED